MLCGAVLLVLLTLCYLCDCRYMGRDRQSISLRPWRSSVVELRENGLENGFSDPAVTPDEPKSEPLPEIPSLLPAENGMKKSILHRQQSLVILTGIHTNTHMHILSLCLMSCDLMYIMSSHRARAR